jgi:hypothetical protein
MLCKFILLRQHSLAAALSSDELGGLSCWSGDSGRAVFSVGAIPLSADFSGPKAQRLIYPVNEPLEFWLIRLAGGKIVLPAPNSLIKNFLFNKILGGRFYKKLKPKQKNINA